MLILDVFQLEAEYCWGKCLGTHFDHKIKKTKIEYSRLLGYVFFIDYSISNETDGNNKFYYFD